MQGRTAGDAAGERVEVTSAQDNRFPSTSTKGSMLGPPLPSSMAPSSLIRPCCLPPSTPTMVQYGCSPLNPRGQSPRGERLATSRRKSFAVAPNASGSGVAINPETRAFVAASTAMTRM
jgi:hypothetical protein